MHPGSSQKIILDFLRRSRKPMPVKDVIDTLLSHKGYKGKSPRNTASALISRCPGVIRKDKLCFLAVSKKSTPLG
jgi:hypothetical protein